MNVDWWFGLSILVVYCIYVCQVNARANVYLLACLHLAFVSLLVYMDHPTQSKYIFKVLLWYI